MANKNELLRTSVRAAAVATTSFVATTAVNCAGQNQLFLEVVYTAGNSTALELYLEGSNDEGTTYFREVTEDVAITGTVTGALLVRSFAAAQAGNLYIPVPFKAGIVRAQIRVTVDATNSSVSCAIVRTQL